MSQCEELPTVDRISVLREIYIPTEEFIKKMGLNIKEESIKDISELNDYSKKPTKLLGIKIKTENLIVQKEETTKQNGEQDECK